MPNITLVTLAGINGFNIGTQVAQMTQPAGSDECGAYALVAATGAFGNPPVAANTVIAYNGNNQLLSPADNFHQLATKVYVLTGILNIQRLIDQRPIIPELVAANGYNSPAALAQVAMTLGRAVTVNATQAGFALLNPLYPGEYARCVGVVGAGSVHVGTGMAPVNYAAPQPGETHIISVQNGGGGLHMLARGSDGNYYDPGNGSLGNTWGDPTLPGFNAASGYTFAGLWLVLS
ncbi:MAG: hypothetical protein PHF31_08325 [Methylobacter sp.]|nr:hypothetical protein [Methylobacter sp.]